MAATIASLSWGRQHQICRFYPKLATFARCAEFSSMVTPQDQDSRSLWTQFQAKLSRLLKQYEDFIGLTDVKEAHERVLAAESKFIAAQQARRDAQIQLASVQSKLKDLRSELDRTQRGEEKYLTLITQEYSVLREEKQQLESFQILESQERDRFATLSSSLRFSHEKERAQAEATKYWSIIGSVCGAVVGIIGTGISNRLKMKELRTLIKEVSVIGDHSSIHSDRSEITPTTETRSLQKTVDSIVENLERQGEVLQEVMTKIEGPVHTNFSPEGLPLSLEELIEEQDRRSNMVALICTATVIVTVPVIVKFLLGK